LPNLRLIGPNIRCQASLGVQGIFLQATSSSHGNEWEDLRNYLLSNLLWDPSCDEERLMREWIDLHYGRAAPPMTRWMDRLHGRAAASGQHCSCLGGKFVDYGVDAADAQAGLRACEEAMYLAGDDPLVRNRIEKASISAYRAAIEPVWYVKQGDKTDPALVEHMRPLANRFLELCKKHGATWTDEGSHHQMDEYEKRLRSVLEL